MAKGHQEVRRRPTSTNDAEKSNGTNRKPAKPSASAGVSKPRKGDKRAPSASDALHDDLGEPQPGAVDYSFYADPHYWNARYSATGTRGAGAYEWFDAGSEDLLPLLGRFIKKPDAVLEVGCGTSGLLKALLDNGHQGELVGVDCAPGAIAWAQEHLAGDGDGTQGRTNQGQSGCYDSEDGTVRGNDVRFVEADAQDLSKVVDGGSVDVVLEKGTLAGLFSAEGGEVGTNVLTEISRVLKPDGGTLVSISPHDPHDENEARNGLNVLEELVFPPLAASPSSAGTAWSCEVHTAEGSSVHIYVLRRRRRPSTRAASLDCSPSLDVTLHCHGQ